MTRSLVLGILAWTLLVGSGPLSGTDQPPDLLSAARNAIGGAEALAHVHSLHVILTRQHLGSSVGMQDDSKSESFSTMHVWLQPPSRLLETVAAGSGHILRSGIDGDRVLVRRVRSEAIEAQTQRGVLRRFALAWLLYDVSALGIMVKDEGTATVNRRIVRVLHASDEVGFDLRLYFDPVSHRLAMTDDFTETSHGFVHVVSGQTVSSSMSSSKRTPQRFTYGDYRRVGGIDLPFSMSREVNQNLDTWHVLKYEINPENFAAEFNR
jgi:hypothetical protein